MNTDIGYSIFYIHIYNRNGSTFKQIQLFPQKQSKIAHNFSTNRQICNPCSPLDNI